MEGFKRNFKKVFQWLGEIHTIHWVLSSIGGGVLISSTILAVVSAGLGWIGGLKITELIQLIIVTFAGCMILLVAAIWLFDRFKIRSPIMSYPIFLMSIGILVFGIGLIWFCIQQLNKATPTQQTTIVKMNDDFVKKQEVLTKNIMDIDNYIMRQARLHLINRDQPTFTALITDYETTANSIFQAYLSVTSSDPQILLRAFS